jgi:hypothetical protein
MMRGVRERGPDRSATREPIDGAHVHVCRCRHERVRVPICVRQYVPRVFVTVLVGLACFPAICRAQESSLALRTLTPLLAATPAPSLSTTTGIVSAAETTEPRPPFISEVTEKTPTRFGILLPLYASFATLQTLDAHSTMRALQNGGVERNPLLRDLAGRPAALFALKAGVTASTIYLTEKLRSRHPVGAIALMVALDSFYAMVIVHNYRATP